MEGVIDVHYASLTSQGVLHRVFIEMVTHPDINPVQQGLTGSLRSYDGNCKENVSLKLNVALSLLRLFLVDHFVQNRRSALSLAWYEWFSCKGKEEKIYCCELPLSTEPQI